MTTDNELDLEWTHGADFLCSGLQHLAKCAAVLAPWLAADSFLAEKFRNQRVARPHDREAIAAVQRQLDEWAMSLIWPLRMWRDEGHATGLALVRFNDLRGLRMLRDELNQLVQEGEKLDERVRNRVATE